MICDCGNELIMGSTLTQLGNELEYMECENCGVVDVNGIDMKEVKND